VSNRKS